MLVSIIFISIAFVLYTVAIWAERIAGGLAMWMVMTFGIGVTCDIVGSTVMFCRVTPENICFHVVAGILALLIMILHFAWAIFATQSPRFAELFSRFSLCAWTVWLVALISGIPM